MWCDSWALELGKPTYNSRPTHWGFVGFGTLSRRRFPYCAMAITPRTSLTRSSTSYMGWAIWSHTHWPSSMSSGSFPKMLGYPFTCVPAEEASKRFWSILTEPQRASWEHSSAPTGPESKHEAWQCVQRDCPQTGWHGFSPAASCHHRETTEISASQV